MRHFTDHLRTIAAKLISSWRSLFGRAIEEPALVAHPGLPLDPQPEPSILAVGPAPAAAEAKVGYHNLRSIHDLLDALPQYFRDLRTLRAVDEDAYDMFATLGGQVASHEDSALFRQRGLPDGFLDNPPAVRCFFYNTRMHGEDGVARMDKDDDTIPVSMMYALRIAGGMPYVARDGGIVQLPLGTCYRLVLVHHYKQHPLAQSCFVHVDSDGKVAVVPERRVYRVPANSRRPRDGSIPQPHFGPPRWLIDQARDRKETVDDIISTLFSLCMSAERPKDAILVRAKKDGMTAAWTIDRRDAKRFFAKRETGEASDGRRKRVLHYVEGFERMRGNRHSQVRAHYRGERSFSWEGYDIEISGLGFHHGDFFDSSVQHYEENEAFKGGRKFMSMDRALKVVAARYRQPVFLSKRKRAA